jgi:uncharacterized protein (DUF111 family)
MKTAFFDCFSGISGDMIVGSLIDAGLELAELKNICGQGGEKRHIRHQVQGGILRKKSAP